MRSILLRKIEIYFHTADLLKSVTAIQIRVPPPHPPLLLNCANIAIKPRVECYVFIRKGR